MRGYIVLSNMKYPNLGKNTNTQFYLNKEGGGAATEQSILNVLFLHLFFCNLMPCYNLNVQYQREYVFRIF